MEDETARVTAKYEEGRFVVTDYDHVLRPPLISQALSMYLDFLAEQQWMATQAAFDGFVLTIELHKSLPVDKRMIYSVQELHFTAFTLAQKGLLEDLKQPMVKFGWKELASSAPLSDLVRGMSFITLWSKTIPKIANA
jgi:hypothetical protein